MTGRLASHAIGFSIAVVLSCQLPASHAADVYQKIWSAYGGFSQRDSASGVAVDSAGNPYLVGETGSIYGMPDSGHFGDFVIKFNPAGNQLWLRELAAGHLHGVAIDASNNLHVAGEARGLLPSAQEEAYLAKLDANGGMQWERRLGSTSNDFGYDVAVDTFGNAYFSGSTNGLIGEKQTTGADAFLAKYSPNDALTWVKQLGMLGMFGTSVAVAPDQSVVSTGYGNGRSFFARIDSNGNVLWNNTLDFAENAAYGTYANKIACDSNGNIFVVGQTNQPDNSFLSDAFVAKFDPTGNLIWQKLFDSAPENSFFDVAVDHLGNVFAVGTTGLFTGADADSYDAMWAKYDSNGNLLWFEQFGTTGNDYLSGIALDAFDHVYMSGSNSYTVNDYYAADVDAFIIRYDLVPEPGAAFLLVAGIPVALMRRCDRVRKNRLFLRRIGFQSLGIDARRIR